MRYLSLFSGIEAASVAWQPIGWQPVAFAEIEPFPGAVLAQRFPGVPNLGDVTRITDEQIAALGHIDLVVGGSPCQDLSVAGRRAGLAGERSGLFYELVRIFHAARKHCGARFLLWENVPGVFSSNQGQDFGEVVDALVGLGFTNLPKAKWENEGVAIGDDGFLEWSVLDAQWFGVAQRRRRCFALLDTGDWFNRPPILLECDGLRGDSPPGRETQQNVAPTLDSRAGRSGANTSATSGGLIVTNAEGADGFTLTVSNLSKGVNNQTPIIVFHGSQDPCVSDDVAHPVGRNRGLETCIATPVAVRRLTPKEAERLQGFPDDHTLVEYQGKPATDTPRYKAIGNSMCVPVMRWIGEQIDKAVQT
jgi:DNA (cytosine-5)-methyltransferase 1